MMQLRKLNRSGSWAVYGKVSKDGECAMELEIYALLANPKTKSTGVSFLAIWDRIPPEGPHKLGEHLYERVNDTHQIYEFRKRGHRVLCFQLEGRVIVCSHVLAKKSQKTPPREIQHAIDLKNKVLKSFAAREIVYE